LSRIVLKFIVILFGEEDYCTYSLRFKNGQQHTVFDDSYEKKIG